MPLTNPTTSPGWAAGTGDGDWLTVWGSAYAHLVYTTRDEAEQRAAELRQRLARPGASRAPEEVRVAAV